MKGLISYAKAYEWNGYILQERKDGNWVYETHNQIQGCNSGRRVVLALPEGLEIQDEDDMETVIASCQTKAEYLTLYGDEIRCLRRGHIVQ